MTAFEQLEQKLPSDLNSKFSYLNGGGCGIVAYFLSRELCKIGIDAKIAWISSGMGDEKAFNNVLKNMNNPTLHDFCMNGIDCRHCMVILDDKLLDSTGGYSSIHDTLYYNGRIEGVITWEEIESVVLSPLAWNHWFDRKDIPKVEKTIKKIVSTLC